MKRFTLLLVVVVAGCAAFVGCATEPGGGGGVTPDGNHLPEALSFSCSPATGVAPLETLCSYQLRDVDNDRIQCQFDVGGDGTPEQTIEDCPLEGSVVFTVKKPGLTPVRLFLTDWRLATSSAETALNVLAPPNTAPVIDSFDVDPKLGGAPLTITATFGVSDADGDALLCRLLDGEQVLAEPKSCGTSETWTASVTKTGSRNVTLEVTDDKGGIATRDVTIQVTELPQVGDLRVSRVEWGQSVISANPRLVADKDALLRAYVLSERSGIQGVVVKVVGTRGGQPVGELTMSGPLIVPTSEVASDMNQQWRATIPAAWLQAGLELRVRVDPANALGETNETNNELAITPTIGAGNVFVMTNVPIVQSGLTGRIFSIEQPMKQVWPVKRVSGKDRAAYTFSGTIAANGGGWGTLLNQLAQLRQADGSRRYYLGWIRVNFGSGVAGLATLGYGTALTRDDSISTAIHELGHTMNREHSPCGGAQGTDPAYPVANARLDVPGYDFVSGRMVPTSQFFDVMSYCDPPWISNHNYKGAQQWLESRPVAETAAYVTSPRIIVGGRLHRGKFTLNPVSLIEGPAEPEAVEAGDYTVTLHGEKDVTVPFKMIRVEDSGEEEGQFSMVLPPVAGLYAVSVSHQGKLVAMNVAGPARPAQRALVKPVPGGVEVSWDATAFPFMSLAHLGTDEHTTLTLFAEGGKAFVSTMGLVDGGAWEVSLSDGVQSQRLVVAR